MTKTNAIETRLATLQAATPVGLLTIDALDRIARKTNSLIRDEITEAFGEKYSYPTVSPAAVRLMLQVAKDMGLIKYMPWDATNGGQDAKR